MKEKENMMAFWGVEVFRNTYVFPPPKYLWCIEFYWGPFLVAHKASVWNSYGLWGDRNSGTVLGGRVEAVENNPNKYSGRHPIDTVWVIYSLSCCWKHCTSVVSLYVQTFSTSAFKDFDSIFQHVLLFWNLPRFDTAIKRKSHQANKGCHNTTASPCGPTQSKKFCVVHWKVWDHSPYSQELYHVTPSVWSHQEGIWWL